MPLKLERMTEKDVEAWNNITYGRLLLQSPAIED